MSQAELDLEVTEVTTEPQESAAEATEADKSKRLSVIEPQSGWRAVNLREMWQTRELFYVLAWRDIKVRYKQTVLGPLWAVIKPLMRIVILSVIFGGGFKMQDRIGDLPYPVFLFVAMLPWQFFADSLSTASGSLVRNQNFLTKIYFPRLIIPISSIGPVLVDFIIAFLVLFGLMLFYGINPGLGLLMLPVLMALVVLASLGVSFIASAVCVAHRDMRNVVQYFIQIGFYMTPILWFVGMFPQKYQWLIAFNPLAGIIGAARFYLLNFSDGWEPWWLLVSAVEVVVLFVVGIYYFRRVEKTFADVV